MDSLEQQTVELIRKHEQRRLEGLVGTIAAAYIEAAPRGPEGPEFDPRLGQDRGGFTRTRRHGRLWTAFNSPHVVYDGQAGDELRWRLTDMGVDDRAAPHGKWVDQPVDEIRPHPPRRYLMWFGQRVGNPIFAKRVRPSKEHAGWWRRFVHDTIPDVLRRGGGL